MKIRKISLENLNSLVGEHVLDLGVEPIASAGIFAITGPTGAGKSTLLDAITLALYGRAARYGGPNPEDMMSRHHGSCRAEVEFEVDGVTYRAEWIRRRARGRADGRLQPATRFIYGADGEPLTQKLADADAMVERLSGLNYERFMRSVLLAQGDFARFLKSKEDERAELLESLTGTEVFSALSARVYDEARSRERELEDEEVRLGAIIPLAPEAREDKEQALGQLEGEQKAARTTLEAVIQNLSRAEELARAQEAEKASLAALKRNQSEREVNRDGLERLGKHRKASGYFPLLERVDDSRKTLERLSVQAAEAIEHRNAARLNLDQGVVSAAALLEGWLRDRGEVVAMSRRECSKIRELIGELEDWFQRHESDSSLTEELPAIFERIEALRGERKNWSTAQSNLRSLEKEKGAGVELRAVREKRMAEAKAALSKMDETREVATTRFEAACSGRDETARRVELDRLGRVIAEREQVVAKEEACSKLKAELGAVNQQVKAAVERRESAAKLLDAHEAHLKTETLRAGLEEHRANLKDGDECPLCGALEHPYTVDGIAIGGRMKEIGAEVAAAKKALEESEKQERDASKAATGKQAQLGSLEQTLASTREAVSSILEQLALTDSDPIALRGELEKRKAGLATLVRARKEAEVAVKAADAAAREVEKLEQARTADVDALAKVTSRMQEATRELDQAVKSGKLAISELEAVLAKFGCDVPEPGGEGALRELLDRRAKAFAERVASKAASLEKLGGIEQKIEGLESEIGRLRDKLDRLEPDQNLEAIEWNMASTEMLDAKLVELEKRLTSASAAASEREKQVKIARDTLAGHETALSAALGGNDIDGEAALREIRIQDEEYGELSALDTRLSDEAKGLEGKIESCAELLKRLRETGVPEGEALVKMGERRETLSASLESVGEKIGALRAELKTDDRNVEILKERGAAMAQLRDRLKLWQRLSGLVGSADGRKFRRFAQGLSLDVLLRHANVHLGRLSDRYQLVRSEGEELGLEIIDRFQASVRRPMASLSGGESFLASLALALGLSDLAGRNVQIDSLFIDEGFGTLDGDTLDEAISALESLRLRDKTVGVISHVELLKERISTQVVVGRDSAGRGKIEVIG